MFLLAKRLSRSVPSVYQQGSNMLKKGTVVLQPWIHKTILPPPPPSVTRFLVVTSRS